MSTLKAFDLIDEIKSVFDLIKTLETIDDKKEAKTLVVDKASEFNLTIKKSKTIDNMVLDLVDHLKEELFNHAAEYQIGLVSVSLEDMVNEFNEKLDKLKIESSVDDTNSVGLSTNDILLASDELQGKHNHIVDEDKPEVDPTAIELLTSAVSTPVKVIEVEEPVSIEVEDEIKVEQPKAKPVEVIKPIEVDPIPVVESKMYVLPERFKPTIRLMGKAPGYYSLPYWIFEWIEKNPDWTTRPKSFPHAHTIDTLLSLIYFIQRDGSVLIRETKNSRFHLLKV